ncbi:Unknown protein sequence [Pseudomonas syringae pv. cilantro]|uniref:Uncharacterized protein n=2 Tax=Pseudomonas syringae group TaxID=136849 RepID=A0A0N1JNS8_PSESX|nr:Unknown protein sequence [Pseudomonas syringae pv. cilantro]KPW75858.1 Unknown protein sequence [Pseudomonas syringae pv. coriandricola]RMN11290.1 hypothetical protein ALQ65_03004 [Pseudomonas syringae pv. coriandricola]
MIKNDILHRKVDIPIKKFEDACNRVAGFIMALHEKAKSP